MQHIYDANDDLHDAADVNDNFQRMSGSDSNAVNQDHNFESVIQKFEENCV